MGFFYYFLGLLISVSLVVFQYSIYRYNEQYPPRSLIFALEGAPLEETVFFGIPFYATGNQFVLLGSGILWTIFHLGNTQPQTTSFSNLAYANFAFSILAFFFAFRTWKSGKGWFSILFHFGWDTSIVILLVIIGQNPWILYSRDSYVYVEFALIPVTPILLAITYWLYKRRGKKPRALHT